MLIHIILKPTINIIRCFSSNSIYFVETINNFSKNNIKYLDSFQIKIKNPKQLNIFNPTIYEGTIWFSKNDMKIYKTFNNNDLKLLMDDVSKFISNEIKI
jgi:hypothetical protein